MKWHLAGGDAKLCFDNMVSRWHCSTSLGVQKAAAVMKRRALRVAVK